MRAVFIRFGGILFLAALAVWLYAVLDAISSDRTQVRALPKGLWVAIVLLTFAVGAVAWLVYGRPRASGTRRPTLGSSGRTAWPARPGRNGDAPANGLFGRGSSRPAPDDDPEFLAGLDQRAARSTRSCSAPGKRTCADARSSCAAIATTTARTVRWHRPEPVNPYAGAAGYTHPGARSCEPRLP